MNSFKEKLKEIYDYNESYFKTLKPNEQIIISKTKQTWGTELVPEELRINVNKKYQTLNGQEVVLHQIRLYSDTNPKKEYTFPVKGSYLIKKTGKKDQWINAIWTLDGRISLLPSDLENGLNLVEIQN